jgi:hypothetical protein
MLSFFTWVTVAPATVRRRTEGDGEASEAVQTAAVESIERELPPSPLGPRVPRLSVDRAMVPLRQQEWAEVKAPVRDRDGAVRAGVPKGGAGMTGVWLPLTELTAGGSSRRWRPPWNLSSMDLLTELRSQGS